MKVSNHVPFKTFFNHSFRLVKHDSVFSNPSFRLVKHDSVFQILVLDW